MFSHVEVRMLHHNACLVTISATERATSLRINCSDILAAISRDATPGDTNLQRWRWSKSWIYSSTWLVSPRLNEYDKIYDRKRYGRLTGLNDLSRQDKQVQYFSECRKCATSTFDNLCLRIDTTHAYCYCITTHVYVSNIVEHSVHISFYAWLYCTFVCNIDV